MRTETQLQQRRAELEAELRSIDGQIAAVKAVPITMFAVIPYTRQHLLLQCPAFYEPEQAEANVKGQQGVRVVELVEVRLVQALAKAVKAGVRLRRTPIVDDDFQAIAHEFDSLAQAATSMIEKVWP